MSAARIIVVVVGLAIGSWHGSARGEDSLYGVEQADSVLVVKSERKLYLLKAGRVLRQFEVALGLMPTGHKQREGDFRTPEGR